MHFDVEELQVDELDESLAEKDAQQQVTAPQRLGADDQAEGLRRMLVMQSDSGYHAGGR